MGRPRIQDERSRLAPGQSQQRSQIELIDRALLVHPPIEIDCHGDDLGESARQDRGDPISVHFQSLNFLPSAIFQASTKESKQKLDLTKEANIRWPQAPPVRSHPRRFRFVRAIKVQGTRTSQQESTGRFSNSTRQGFMHFNPKKYYRILARFDMKQTLSWPAGPRRTRSC